MKKSALIKIGFIIFLIFGIFFSHHFCLAGNSLGDLLESLGDHSGLGESAPDEDSLATAIAKMVGIFLSFIGIIFLILVIYGGFLWMTAAGNEGQIEKARKILIRSLIGIIIILASYLLSWFVLKSLESISSVA